MTTNEAHDIRGNLLSVGDEVAVAGVNSEGEAVLSVVKILELTNYGDRAVATWLAPEGDPEARKTNFDYSDRIALVSKLSSRASASSGGDEILLQEKIVGAPLKFVYTRPDGVSETSLRGSTPVELIVRKLSSEETEESHYDFKIRASKGLLYRALPMGSKLEVFFSGASQPALTIGVDADRKLKIERAS